MEYKLGLTFKIFLSIFILCLNNLNAKSDIEKIGDYLQFLIPAYGLYLGIQNNDTKGIKQLSKSVISTSLSTQILKHTIKRQRPDGSDTNSFPSGHTSAAFSGAFYIHSRYQNTTQSIIAYTLASFVGYSRVYAKKHYMSDVIAGALISYAFDKYFVNTNTNISAAINKNEQHIYISWKI